MQEAGEAATEAAEGAETEEQIRARLEEQIRAECEAEIDRRITQAYRTFQRQQEKEKEAERLKLQEADQAEQEKRAEAGAEQEHALNVKGCRLDLVDIVAEAGLPGAFRTLIACDDLADVEERERYRKLQERVISTSVEFNRLVREEVDRQKKIMRMSF